MIAFLGGLWGFGFAAFIWAAHVVARKPKR